MDTNIERISALALTNTALYGPLPGPSAIRLLELHAVVEAGQISGSLTTFTSLTECPGYTALSYCWGDISDVVKGKVACNQHNITITRNLYNALLRLQPRALEPPLFVWVDAICIDQYDNEERARQVQLMRDIYANAFKVCVWLGDLDDATEVSLRAVQEIAAICCPGESSSTLGGILAASESDIDRLIRNPTLQGRSGEYWCQLCALLHRPWFRRIWVVQEVQSNANCWMLCGDQNIHWRLVAFATSWLSYDSMDGRLIDKYSQQHGSMTADPTDHADPAVKCIDSNPFIRVNGFRQATFMAYVTFRTCADNPLLSVLAHSRASRASDPRDKIFAMLNHPVSLVRALSDNQSAGGRHRNHQLDLQPDYKKNPLQVLLDVARESILQTGSLDILSYYFQGQQEPEFGSPLYGFAWVPDWGNVGYHIGYPLPTWRYNASKSRRCNAVFSANLKLQGICVGTVSKCHRLLTTAESAAAEVVGPREMIHVKSLQTLARLLTADMWGEFRTAVEAEGEALRGKDYQEQHFADFATWLLPFVERTGGGFYLNSLDTWCSECQAPVLDSEHLDSPVYWHTCLDCSTPSRLFSVCVECLDLGKRYLGASHVLSERPDSGIWYEHSSGNDQQLRKAASVGGDASRFCRLRSVAQRKRHWFQTSTGYVGAGHLSMRQGDHVVILFGTRVPFILHPLADGRYKLIGDCYVDGMMDGEAIEILERGELDVDEYALA